MNTVNGHLELKRSFQAVPSGRSRVSLRPASHFRLHTASLRSDSLETAGDGCAVRVIRTFYPRALWFSWSSSCPISPHLLQPDRNPPSGWPAHLRAGFRWIRWRRARALRPVRSRRADPGWWTSSARLMELLRRVGMETRWEVRPVSTRLLVVSVISQTLTAARITCGPSVTTPSTRYRTSTSTGRQKRRWERNSSDRHSLNYTMSPTRWVCVIKHHLTAYLTLLFLKSFIRHKNVK